jgi:MFS family permease
VFNLPRAVWLLGWVSLATDSATETIYPLLPFFLTTVLGAGAVSLGIVEGAAEAVNSVLKIWSGRVADRSPRKRPIVLAGYGISSLVRPFIAVASSWTQVFAVRVLDRVGKGIRSAPRDAMLASFATPTTRGKVFGFHRAMDHTGAIIGPALASLFLWFYPGAYRALFALTIVPGAIAVALIFLVRERPDQTPSLETGGPASLQGPPLSRELKTFLSILSLFTLGNSSDAFLLLKLTEVAGSPKFIPLVWAALHVVKAATSVVGGSWSDRAGRRAIIGAGWVVYAAVYAGFATAATLPVLVLWFLVYGVYFGFAEGTEKALIADLAPIDRRGFAFGVFNAVQGLGSLAASLLFGVLWTAFGAGVAFGVGAALALASTVLLFAALPRESGTV